MFYFHSTYRWTMCSSTWKTSLLTWGHAIPYNLALTSCFHKTWETTRWPTRPLTRQSSTAMSPWARGLARRVRRTWWAWLVLRLSERREVGLIMYVQDQLVIIRFLMRTWLQAWLVDVKEFLIDPLSVNQKNKKKEQTSYYYYNFWILINLTES